MAGKHDHTHEAHGHRHGDGHHHQPTTFGAAFAIGSALNTAFVVAEIVYGLSANSMALVADAAHNLIDVLGLVLAGGAAWLARRNPSHRRTYGWRRGTILASLINAVVLLVSVGAIAIEAINRLAMPEQVAEGTVMWVAALGILVNGGSALLFLRGRDTDLNVKGAFLHLAADAAVSLGVVLAAFAISLTGWLWIDSATSLAIVVVIIAGTWALLRDSANLAMDAIPQGVERRKIEEYLRGLPGVVDIHDLHIWGLSTTDIALTVHLERPDAAANDALLRKAATDLKARFGIGHTTIQIETSSLAADCDLAPDTVV